MTIEFDDVFGPSGAKVVEIAIYVPSADRDGRPLQNQALWRDRAMGVLAELFGAATALGPVDGVWKNPRTGQLIREKPILAYAYASEREVHDKAKLESIRDFCLQLGTQTRQGEVMLKIGDRLMYIETW